MEKFITLRSVRFTYYFDNSYEKRNDGIYSMNLGELEGGGLNYIHIMRFYKDGEFRRKIIDNHSFNSFWAKHHDYFKIAYQHPSGLITFYQLDCSEFKRYRYRLKMNINGKCENLSNILYTRKSFNNSKWEVKVSLFHDDVLENNFSIDLTEKNLEKVSTLWK